MVKWAYNESNAKIVVISDWRYGSKRYVEYRKGNTQYAAQCDNWVQLEETYFISIYDVIPWDKKLKTRAEEIDAYLKSSPRIYNYVILDDCYQDDYSSNADIQEHLVQIDALKGLQDSDLVKACEVMNRLNLHKW